MPAIKAVIFDMDGVLIDSEHLWRKAMIKGFREYGLGLSEADCRKTMGMRIGEVIALWLVHFDKSLSVAAELEKRIISLLLELIEATGKPINGIPALIEFCGANHIPMGLATSSSKELMHAVIKKLGIAHSLKAAVSAENMKYAKPHPEVFIECAEQMGMDPVTCLVIEDSLNGVIAAKAARMQVIAVPEQPVHDVFKEKQFVLADHRMNDMHEVLAFFKAELSQLLPK